MSNERSGRRRQIETQQAHASNSEQPPTITETQKHTLFTFHSRVSSSLHLLRLKQRENWVKDMLSASLLASVVPWRNVVPIGTHRARASASRFLFRPMTPFIRQMFHTSSTRSTVSAKGGPCLSATTAVAAAAANPVTTASTHAVQLWKAPMSTLLVIQTTTTTTTLQQCPAIPIPPRKDNDDDEPDPVLVALVAKWMYRGMIVVLLAGGVGYCYLKCPTDVETKLPLPSFLINTRQEWNSLGVAAKCLIVLPVALHLLHRNVPRAASWMQRYLVCSYDVVFHQRKVWTIWTTTLLHGGWIHLGINVSILMSLLVSTQLNFPGSCEAPMLATMWFVSAGLGGVLQLAHARLSRHRGFLMPAPYVGISGMVVAYFALMSLYDPRGEAYLIFFPWTTFDSIHLLWGVVAFDGLAYLYYLRTPPASVLRIAHGAHLGGVLASLLLYTLFAQTATKRTIHDLGRYHEKHMQARTRNRNPNQPKDKDTDKDTDMTIEESKEIEKHNRRAGLAAGSMLQLITTMKPNLLEDEHTFIALLGMLHDDKQVQNFLRGESMADFRAATAHWELTRVAMHNTATQRVTSTTTAIAS